MQKYTESIAKLNFSNLGKTENFTHRWSTMDTGFHQHMDFFEISLITQNSYHHYYESIDETLEAGTLLLFNAKQIHRLTPNTSDSIHFTICLTKPYFKFLMQIFSFEQSIFDKTNYIKCKLDHTSFQYLNTIANALTNHDSESHYIRLFFHNAMSLLTKNATENPLLNQHDFVDDILEKIHNYSYLTISVQDIYKHYPYSIPTIIRKFKQRTGTTIIRYQTNERLDCAARLMRETNHSLEEIIANLGFQSTGHFYDIFKSRYGTTPNVYRSIAKEHPESEKLLPIDSEH